MSYYDHSVWVKTGSRRCDLESFGITGGKVVAATCDVRDAMLGMTGKQAWEYCLAKGWAIVELGART